MRMNIYYIEEEGDIKCEFEKREGFTNEVTQRCSKFAKYEVEGEKLCEKHAGRKLISYYLHESKDR